MVGDIRIDPDATTVYYVIPPKTDAILIAGDDTDNTTTTTSSSWTIKPYARTDDASAMALVSEWSVKMVSPAGNDHQHLPNCTQVHDPPGVFFSLGGYSGNHYHGFADVLIPLFVTSRPFDRQVELLVIDTQPWMVNKVKTIMQALSRFVAFSFCHFRYDEVDIDRSKQDGKIHCFSRLVIGLKGRGRKELGISPLETDYTMKDFRQFLRSSYSLRKTRAIKLRIDNDDDGDKKNPMMNNPQLIIISRKGSRAFTNVNEIAGMATKLGYYVKVVEPDDKTMSESAEMMNSCDVVVGVHGAGLTNMVFLPDNAVVVQVIPLALDWSAKIYYEEPTKEMNLRYLQYKIKKEESSLIGRYSPDHVVFTTPWSFKWEEFRSIYMQNQNVTVDLRRFRPTLVKALELLHD
ncbi:unnamed protein product [Linum tenue]|uniref:Glycosyltransferase 61 catalytic domain-containing protein n=1 Tax=Linum tenue TaxID=586396 RepID=A0AAV0QXT7_9ROSI|nr:unnamed protein product [Linum tenue]